MLEIMGKMILCLTIALLLGFLLGWWFSRALKRERGDIGLEIDEEDGDELYGRIRQLEKLYAQEKALSSDYQQKNQKLKDELMKKVNLLNNTSDTLRDVKNKSGTEEIRAKLLKKEVELQEFEKVLIKAEETIEAQEALIIKLQS